jgi:hypothetical protein
VIASQRPRLHVAPPAESTFGDLAAEFSADYGLLLDDWQQFVLNDWLALGPDGLWASLDCGLACPRQNGKNGILEVRELFGMVGRGEKILHTAHEVKTARKAFKRLQFFFGKQVNDPGAKFPELNARVIELRNVNGQEAIYLENGGSVEIVARSKNSGRGFTVDVLIFDEAQEMSDDDLEAITSASSAAPLGNPQWIYTGTPPGPRANGEVFTRTRLNALSDNPGRACWHEWSACDPEKLPELDLDDQELWFLNNPALDSGRLQLPVVAGERRKFTDEGFARERLGVWRDPALAFGSVIPLGPWRSCGNPEAERSERVAYAIDASPDLTDAAIGASDGRVGKVLEHHGGVSWLPARLKELVDERPGVVKLDPKAPISALITDLDELGIEWEPVSPQEHAEACGSLLKAVLDGQFVHTDQPVLDEAVEGATRRNYGDAWAWSRRNAAVSICSLVVVTIARWAALQAADGPVEATMW